MKADMRCNPFEVLKSELIRETLYNQFLKLMHMAETLNSEQIIETDTRDIIEQIALDFKLALQAVDEAVDKINVAPFSKTELCRIRQYVCKFMDETPGYVEGGDLELQDKINRLCEDSNEHQRSN